MKESLRYKDVQEKKEKSSLAIKVENASPEMQQKKKRDASLKFREMWADAFMRKSHGLVVADTVEKKQKAPSPYIYLRVLFMLVAMMIITLSILYFFKGYEFFPIAFVLIVAFIPAVLLVFFFEMDTSSRLSIYSVLKLFFLSIVLALAICFVSNNFIYETGGKVLTYYGAIAIGLMETIVVYTACALIVSSLKVKDIITAILIGAIVGGGFAITNCVNACFKYAFIETNFAPTYEILMYNEMLQTSFTNILKSCINEYVFRSINYIFMGVMFSGTFCLTYSKGFKERSYILLTIMIYIAGLLFATIQILNFSLEIINLLVRLIITISTIIAVFKMIRTGLSRNTYE